jgi:hypothetical protein
MADVWAGGAKNLCEFRWSNGAPFKKDSRHDQGLEEMNFFVAQFLLKITQDLIVSGIQIEKRRSA